MLPLLPAIAGHAHLRNGHVSEEELVLQGQYSQLCTEKCRLLSAIEQSNREGRALQNEIHRILEFLAEVVPEAPSASDDEQGSDFGGGEWLHESDEEQQMAEDARETRKVYELKERYRQMKATTERRRSISPERRPARPRRSYKNLPLREDGKVDLPVILGRGVHRIILLQLGEVVPSAGLAEEKYIFPVGFQCKRKYYTFDADPAAEKAKKIYYFCTIRGTDDRPLFEISTSGTDSSAGTAVAGGEEEAEGDEEGPTETLATGRFCDSDQDLGVLWERFQKNFVSDVHARLVEDFGCPETFFGMEHDSLAKHLRETAAAALAVWKGDQPST